MRPLLLCLHGWGGSRESFTELREALKGTTIEILTPDLPGFGAEPEPDRPWTTEDYADWVVRWLQQQWKVDPSMRSGGKWKETTFLLLGHSHGGRIAIKLAARPHSPFSILHSQLSKNQTILISHLYLCAPAGIRHPRHFKRILGLTLAKAGAFFLAIPGLRLLQPMAKKFLYRLVRVHDYEKASHVMRETLRKVSAEDLTPLLPMITVPTDIFWGEDDGMTPVSDARLMHRLIAGSELHVFPGTRHRVHRDRAMEIAAVIRRHLGS